MTDTVIFDLDGTLLDTLEDLTDSVNHAMETFGFPTHTHLCGKRRAEAFGAQYTAGAGKP